MNKIELLAPAGSKESLIAAVQNGADAVYLGGTKFSARAYASNFDRETIEWAIDYCHLYGVKVYITMNTLIKDEEMEEALQYANFLHNIGVDALIIQDVGLAYELHNRLPNLELHASTQMTIHNAEGAAYMKERGFERIVLSRELSIDEVAKVSKDYKIETEMFIHGALCISYSGQCLMSSTIGGRSGNRGRCAQPCRLPYKIFDSKGQKKEGYLMSPKDVCTIEDIEKIINSGTSSLKIEGRMKRPEYVAGIVSSYRKVIDHIYAKNKLNKKDIAGEKKILTQLFNREGFSKAYLFGNIGRDMMSINFPKNTGIRVGKVKNNRVILEDSVTLGDGIRIGDGGFLISSIQKGNGSVQSAVEGDTVELKPKRYKNGDILFKTSDTELNKSLLDTYRDSFGKKIDIPCSLEFRVGYPLSIKTSYEGKTYMAKGEVVQEALKKPIPKDKVQKNLSKSGDTPFRFGEIEFQAFEDGFIPISALNDVRRRIIKDIENDVTKKDKNRDKLLDEMNNEEKLEGKMPSNLLVVKNRVQLDKCREMRVKNICVDITPRGMWSISKEEIKGCYLKVPNIIKDKEFGAVVKKINELRDSVKGIVTGNFGIINKFKGDMVLIGDYKLNIFNQSAIAFYESDLSGMYISAELNKKEIAQLVSLKRDNLGIVAYGKVELMVSEYCPIGATFGGKTWKKSCDKACERSKFFLNDRMNAEFKIETDIFCRSYIYNNVPLDLTWNKAKFEVSKLDTRIDFVHENERECESVLNYMRDRSDEISWSTTKGQYNRGVE